MAPKLYITERSTPSRSVLMTANAIGLRLEIQILDFATKEHFSPDFLKLNPQHTVPTLVEEDGYVLWDSHAINAYLVEKYGTSDSLYPKDLRKRGIVDQRLAFDNGILFPILSSIVKPIDQGLKIVPYVRIEEITNAYAFLNTFLENSKFVAGDSLTIADFNILSTITSLDFFCSVDPIKFPNLSEWFLRLKKSQFARIGEKAVGIFKELRDKVTVATE